MREVTAGFVREALPPRAPDGHKGTFGRVLIVGGSVGFTGAPYLTAAGAVRAGCGLVYLGVPRCIWPVEAGRCISSMPFPLPDDTDAGSEAKGMLDESAFHGILEKLEGCDVLALGPGLGRSAGTERLVCALLAQTDRPVVLDADGINALAAHIDVLDARRDRVTILTPHEGEFARLGGELSAGREQAARCWLVLKGHRTLTVGPQGDELVNTTGNSGMAKGGSGDVLTGVIASLLAQGAAPMQAAAAGVWLHGRAGDLAAAELTAYGMTPADLTDRLPEALRELADGKTN